ncbi:MAG: histidinol-phosphate transaminase [Deltaproteobacteria bacterium]|nr:histidinol-phosphate transaminase [Deltaproteobacteria bacterium]
MSFELSRVIRPNVLKCRPYSSARDEFEGEARVYLDANENSFGSALSSTYCRYPDPLQRVLKEKLSALKGVPQSSIFLGNGSDEAIDLLVRAACEPEKDSIIVMPPTYGMYEVCASIQGALVKAVPLLQGFAIDTQGVMDALGGGVKIVFICSPNNPTGNAFEAKAVEDVIKASEAAGALVALDEAYVDFCPDKSFLPRLSEFKNLVILQTFSKAWGLAEIRLGAAYASPELTALLAKIKPPYNVNGVTQRLAAAALENTERKDELVSRILDERARLIEALGNCKLVRKVHPSDANFILVECEGADNIYEQLLKKGIVVRNRSQTPGCEGCLRITVGTKDENEEVLSSLNETQPALRAASILNSASQKRRASRRRKTNETDICIDLVIDGSGRASIKTGVGFFDHMLEQLVRHSRIDLTLECAGDLKVDEHHTVEDVAIALGECFLEAVGDKRGIERYGFVLPMDESQASVSIDLSGRSSLVWKAEFKREKVGEMPTEMFSHFFKSFSDSFRCALHIAAYGENEHHKIEAIFKCFARALRAALNRDEIYARLPTTKGVI